MKTKRLIGFGLSVIMMFSSLSVSMAEDVQEVIAYEIEGADILAGTTEDNSVWGQTILGGQVTDNASDNNYTRYYASVVKSYMVEASDSSLVRVEYTGSGILVERYTSDGTLTDTRSLECELPLFGGFYAGADAYYLVFGQTNPEESDSVEVMRVVKYSKDWERLDETNIYGAYTYIPFDAGSLRMTETGGKLYIHTCHEMYAVEGVNHQANMTFVIDEDTMTVSDSWYEIMNISYGYVSHSFDQYIQTDGTYIYRVDLNDASNRGITITRCGVNKPIISVGLNRTIAFKIHEATTAHYNYTGVSVGGFELSENNCLIVGNSVVQDEGTYDVSGQRNILLTVTDKDLINADTDIIWLTNYNAEDGITPRTPQLIKLDDNSFLIMWEEYNSTTGEVKTNMVTVDGDGNLTSNQVEAEMRLSDCQPIVTSNGLVTWYVSDGTSTILYTLNSDINIWDFGNGPHEFGEPVIENKVPATCTEDGRYESVVYCSICGTEMSRESVTIPATGHSYESSVTQEPSCTEDGTMTYICSSCGDSYTEPVPAAGHTWGEPEFAWSDDYISCVAVFTCENGDDSQKAECVVTSTDNGDGIVTYTATVEFNGISYEYTLIVEQEGEPPEDPSGSDTDEDDIIGSGTCGDNLTWVLTGDGTLTISGTGKMENYSYMSYAPWYSLWNDIAAVVIENGVTSIGDQAFSGCTSLVSVTIPDTVTNVGYGAFMDCVSLTDITIPGSVTGTGNNAFVACNNLKNVTISEGVTSIDDYSFCECSAMESIIIPESVTNIGIGAFWECSKLESITILSSVASIDENAFLGNDYYSGISENTTVYCYRGSTADDASLYPEGVTIVYIEEETPDDIAGDLTGDGKVTTADALAAARLAIGQLDNEELLSKCDYNNDGKVTVTDALVLARYAIGEIDTLN